MIGALIAAGASLASTIGGAISQRKSEKRTLKANQKLAEETYSRDLEMWNKANEYNTPEAQMLRYNKAGLNPNLIYSQGSSGNAAQTMPKYNAPTAQFNQLPIAEGIQNTISTYQDIQLKNAQIKNTEASAEINQTKALWSYMAELYKVSTGRAKFNIANALAQMMTGDYTDYDIDPKNRRVMGWSGDFLRGPSEWQKYYLENIKGKGRAAGLAYDKVAAEINKLKAATDYQKLMTDWYSGKQIIGLLGTLGGVAGKVLRGGPGRANPGGMTKAQSKKLEEFKKTFIKNYERK